MRILTLDNLPFSMANIPDEVDDLRFCVLDNSNPKDPDHYFIPLIFMESFNSPALVLRINGNEISVPVDWQILIGEAEFGDLEVIPVTSLNDRGFSAFMFNALTSFRPEFKLIDVVDIYQDIKWYAPKLKLGQMLSVPLNDEPNPPCVYLVKELSRHSEVVDFGKIW